MSHEIKAYLLIFIVSISGILVGLLVEKIGLKQLAKYAKRTKFEYDDIIVKSLNGLIVSLFAVIAYWATSNYLLTRESFLGVSNKICFSIFTMILVVLFGRLSIGLIKYKTNFGSGSQHSSSIVLNITRVSIFLIGVMLILQTFGVSIAPILTALGVGGLAIALALQETLSNLFSGIQIIASKKIRNGDYIKLDSGEEGYVEDITWRNTIIRALQNNLIIIPNSKLSSVIITNFNFPDAELAVLIEVGVSYDSDLKLVEKVTIEAAKEICKLVDGGVKTFEPFIRYHTFADSSINFTVILRGHEFGNQFLIKHEFIKTLHEKYKESGIEIPFPIRTVHLKNT
jgi:small-conductance mechanosensitive channel